MVKSKTMLFHSDVLGCARCGEDHTGKDNIKFKWFTNPVQDTDGTEWNCFGVCPVVLEPILMKVIETKS